MTYYAVVHPYVHGYQNAEDGFVYVGDPDEGSLVHAMLDAREETVCGLSAEVTSPVFNEWGSSEADNLPVARCTVCDETVLA